MTNWLCITSEEDWNVVKNKKVWGVSEKDRKKIERLKTGDNLVFYVRQRILGNHEIIEPRLEGIFKVTSKAFRAMDKIFSTGETFPLRVKIREASIPKKPIDFKELVPNLKFVRNKKKWFLHLQVSMRTIPYEDFDLIRSKMKR